MHRYLRIGHMEHIETMGQSRYFVVYNSSDSKSHDLVLSKTPKKIGILIFT